MVVKNHPRTALELWRCEPCETRYHMEQNRLVDLAREEKSVQEKRDAYEKPLLTTFDALEVCSNRIKTKLVFSVWSRYNFFTKQEGKYLKGFLWMLATRDGKQNFAVYLNESAFDSKNNPSPRNLMLVVNDNSRDLLWNGAACVKLANLIPDRYCPDKKIMIVKDLKPGVVFPGLDIPGYEETL